MASLEYSTEALEAKSLFYNKPVVFVEGEDDTLFWDYLFDISSVDVHIEDLGGGDIKLLISKIINENAEILVACDRDHSDFTNKIFEHDRIVMTYGYSIENSMYNLNCINTIVSKFCKKRTDVSDKIIEWKNRFCEDVHKLVVYDVANHLYNKSVPVMKYGSSRFLSSNKSSLLSQEKVDLYIESIKDKFSDHEINHVSELLNQSEKDLWFHIKGHFLTNAIMNLIKKLVKIESGNNITISNDMLYVNSVDCSGCVDNIDISYVLDKILFLNSIN